MESTRAKRAVELAEKKKKLQDLRDRKASSLRYKHAIHHYHVHHIHVRNAIPAISSSSPEKSASEPFDPFIQELLKDTIPSSCKDNDIKENVNEDLKKVKNPTWTWVREGFLRMGNGKYVYCILV